MAIAKRSDNMVAAMIIAIVAAIIAAIIVTIIDAMGLLWLLL